MITGNTEVNIVQSVFAFQWNTARHHFISSRTMAYQGQLRRLRGRTRLRCPGDRWVLHRLPWYQQQLFQPVGIVYFARRCSAIGGQPGQWDHGRYRHVRQLRLPEGRSGEQGMALAEIIGIAVEYTLATDRTFLGRPVGFQSGYVSGIHRVCW